MERATDNLWLEFAACARCATFDTHCGTHPATIAPNINTESIASVEIPVNPWPIVQRTNPGEQPISGHVALGLGQKTRRKRSAGCALVKCGEVFRIFGQHPLYSFIDHVGN